MIFIDTDSNRSTGFPIGYMGADYLLSIYGEGKHLKKYSAGYSDGSWEPAGSFDYALRGNMCELRTLKIENAQILLYYNDGFEHYSSIVTTTPMLSVEYSGGTVLKRNSVAEVITFWNAYHGKMRIEQLSLRNIGNFVPPFSPDNDFHATAAAIEYAVSHLEVNDIIVCGHSDCGAIKELFLSHKPSIETIHTQKWLQLGEPAKEITLHHFADAPLEQKRSFAEKVSVVFQMENLLTYPSVKKRVEEDRLFLHAWHYDLASGEIFYFDENELEFKPLGND